MLGEFLSANVCVPFLLFMVRGVSHRPGAPIDVNVNFRQPGFGEFKDEAEVAFWTGILGEVLRSRILSVLTSAISFNFLFNAISDVLAMGTSLKTNF